VKRHGGSGGRGWADGSRVDNHTDGSAPDLAAGFDPVWFGVIVTINMEIGLITPPVGLNLFVVNAIAPDVPTSKILWGSVPYVAMMILALIIMSIFPEIATWLPDQLMGVAAGSK